MRHNHWRTPRKFGDDADIAAHSSYSFSERRKQKIAALFEATNAVLGDSESFGHASLCKFPRFAQIAEAHFFGDNFGGAGSNFLALNGIQPLKFGANIYRHGYSLSF
jgi:hypothetical protein